MVPGRKEEIPGTNSFKIRIMPVVLNYGAEIVWIEIEKDESGFLGFIDEVMDVLELPEAPDCSPSCQWCGYVSRLSDTMER